MAGRCLAIAACVLLAATAGGTAAGKTNLIKNGKFASGNKDFTTGYTLSKMKPDRFQNGVHGIYTIEPAGSIGASSAYGDWTNIDADPVGTNGNVYVADGSTASGTVVWSQTVTVTPGTNYTFAFYGAEVSNACCSNAQLAASVNGSTIGTLSTVGSWTKGAYAWNSGSATSATLTLIDTDTDGTYNDFALDYLSFAPGKK